MEWCNMVLYRAYVELDLISIAEVKAALNNRLPGFTLLPAIDNAGVHVLVIEFGVSGDSEQLAGGEAQFIDGLDAIRAISGQKCFMPQKLTGQVQCTCPVNP